MFDLGQRGHGALQSAVADVGHRLASDAEAVVNLHSGNELLLGGGAASGSGSPLGAGAEVVARDGDARTSGEWDGRRRHTSNDGVAVLEPVAEYVGNALPADDDVLAWTEAWGGGAHKGSRLRCSERRHGATCGWNLKVAGGAGSNFTRVGAQTGHAADTEAQSGQMRIRVRKVGREKLGAGDGKHSTAGGNAGACVGDGEAGEIVSEREIGDGSRSGEAIPRKSELSGQVGADTVLVLVGESLFVQDKLRALCYRVAE